MDISPKYLMKLVDQIEKAIWDEFSSYKNVYNYISKWHESDDFNNWENFCIYYKSSNSNEIDLNKSLHNISGETLIKMAIDLGIETPDYIPAIHDIKNVLKDSYSTAFNSFQKALKQIEEHPDLAIGSANSTLESIIKHILENDNIPTELNKRDTLYALTGSILKEFSLFPNEKVPTEIRDIGSSLLNISQNIEKLRSQKTSFHGKVQSDYIIEEPLYAYFIVNTVSTLGLFLLSFYDKKYNQLNINKKNKKVETGSEINIDDIPF